MKISLIVSTYESPKALAFILKKLQRGTRLPDQILVADDGSGDETRAVMESAKRDALTRIDHVWQEDEGFRKCRVLNQAIAQTIGDYIIFLDGDCVPSKSFVADHESFARSGYFIQGRRAYIKEDAVDGYLEGCRSLVSLWLSGNMSGVFKAVRWPRPIIRCNQNQRGLIGCNLSAWREDIVKINGFDERYHGWGREDSDFCTRLYHLGCERLLLYGRGLVYHLNHPVLSRERDSRNHAMLDACIKNKTVRAEQGLDQYL